MFEEHKRTFLVKKDKSRKGSLDLRIKSLVDLINSRSDYCTTSSCSGRILLVEAAKRKEDVNYLFCSHKRVILDEIVVALNKKSKGDVWLKQENAILHVACMSLGCAARLVNSAKASGFRRSGITAFGRKIVVEIACVDSVSLLVKRGGSIFADTNYLEIICNEMNRKLSLNYKKIGKLFKSLERL